MDKQRDIGLSMAKNGEIDAHKFQWNPKDQPWQNRPVVRIPLSFVPLSLAAFLGFQFFQLRGYQGMIASRLVLYGSGFLVLLFVWMLASSLPQLRKTVGITLALVVIGGCISLDVLRSPVFPFPNPRHRNHHPRLLVLRNNHNLRLRSLLPRYPLSRVVQLKHLAPGLSGKVSTVRTTRWLGMEHYRWR